MSADLEARFRVRLDGAQELTGFFERGNRDARTFQSNISNAFGSAAKDIASFGLQTAKSLAHLATGNIGIAQTAKNVLEFRDSLSDLAVQAGLSDSQIGGLADQIHNVAKASNQMQGDVTEALQAFVARTGDIDTARKNLELYAKVATATGASLKDVALVGVELADKLKIKDPAQQAQALAILTAQGRAGAIEIKDLATKAPAVFSAASSMFGVNGIEGLRGTGALAEVFAKAFGGTGSAASVSTSIQNTFKDILAHQDAIEKAGIKVGGRDPYEVIKDLIVKTNGDPRQLMRAGGHGVFDIRAMRGIMVMAEEFRRTGNFGTFDAFKNIAGADINGDAARRMSTGAAQLKATQISIAASADKNLNDKFDEAAKHAHLLSDAFDWVTSHLKISAAAAATALVGWKALFGGGGGGLGGGGLMGMLGAGRPIPVYVTNPGGVGGMPGGASGPGFLQSAGMVAAAGAAGYALGTYLDSKLHLSDRIASAIDGGHNQRMEDSQARIDKYNNARIKSEREIKIMDLERQGLSHGQAVYAAGGGGYAIDPAVLEKAVREGMKGAKVVAVDDGTRGAGIYARRGR